jgi:hypothetical protein
VVDELRDRGGHINPEVIPQAATGDPQFPSIVQPAGTTSAASHPKRLLERARPGRAPLLLRVGVRGRARAERPRGLDRLDLPRLVASGLRYPRYVLGVPWPRTVGPVLHDAFPRTLPTPGRELRLACLRSTRRSAGPHPVSKSGSELLP